LNLSNNSTQHSLTYTLIEPDDEMMNFCSGGPGLVPSYGQPFPFAYDQRQQFGSNFVASPSLFFPHDIATGNIAAGPLGVYRGGYPVNFRNGAPPQEFPLPVQQPLPPARLVPGGGLPIRSHHIRANHAKRQRISAAPYCQPALTKLSQRQARRVCIGGSQNNSSNISGKIGGTGRRLQSVVPVPQSTFPEQLRTMAEETQSTEPVPFQDGTGSLDDLQNFNSSQTYEPELTVRPKQVYGVYRAQRPRLRC
jgi:hypothetical protein